MFSKGTYGTLMVLLIGAAWLTVPRPPATAGAVDGSAAEVDGYMADGDELMAAFGGAATEAPLESRASASAGLIHGRVTTTSGAIHEGRLRWGGDEEAWWGDYFNGYRQVNPWAGYAVEEYLPTERISFGIFGREFFGWDSTLRLGRPFMVRFGDIAKIEPRGRDLDIVLKSGSTVTLDRYEADDVADGVRIWETHGGVVDLNERAIESVEFFAGREIADADQPLFATVHSSAGRFTGQVEWNRRGSTIRDELHGFAGDTEHVVPFGAIRSIVRTDEGARIHLVDGEELLLTGSQAVGENHRGVYVTDPRYGRVLVPWAAFERIDFETPSVPPAYDDFSPGRTLMGTVVLDSGERVGGRLVFDLDEGETTATLDAPRLGVHYTIPFELVSTISGPAHAGVPEDRHAVTLWSGEVIELERDGDLGWLNAGVLVFGDADERARHLPWGAVARIELDPQATSSSPRIGA